MTPWMGHAAASPRVQIVPLLICFLYVRVNGGWVRVSGMGKHIVRGE